MTEKVAAPPSARPGLISTFVQNRSQGGLVGVAAKYGMLGNLVVLVIVSEALYPSFLHWSNIQNLLTQNVPTGLVAVGMTYAIIAGGFDLSAGAITGAACVVAADLANRGLPVVLVLAGTVGAGLVLGAINAFIVTKLHVNPFVATLGTSYLYTGGMAAVLGVNPVQVNSTRFTSFGAGSFASVSYAVWCLLAVLLVAGFVLARTVYGRSVYAVGGNADAAHLAGTRVDLTRAITYLVTGGCAALAGALLAASLSQGEISTGGSALTFNAIIAVVIGGTSLFGGEGAMWRTAVGVLILGVLTTLFDQLAVNSNWQELVEGAILILAVALDAFIRRRTTR